MQSLGGAFTSTQSTHLLKMDDGTNLYLRSEKIDLTSDKFTNKVVEVMGEIIRTKDGNQVMTVESIDVLDQETTQENDLPQWVEYNSENLDLAFKYRDDYEVFEIETVITVKRKPEQVENSPLPPETDDLTVIKSVNQPVSEIKIELLSSKSEDLTDLMKVTSLDSADVLAGGYTKSKVTQKALDAYKIVNAAKSETTYYLLNSSGVYRISFTFVEDETDKVSFQNMFYDILASIDFDGEVLSADKDVPELINTDIVPMDTQPTVTENDAQLMEEPTIISSDIEITGFTTFQSESAGFSVQYPKSYYFGASDTKSNDASRSYEFGSKPLEESPGEIILERINSAIPTGSQLNINGKAMTKVATDLNVQLYTEVNGKLYRISGPSNKEAIMRQMLSTIE